MQHFVFWHWLAIAAILFILEVVSGSGFLLCIGIAAGVVGAFVWLMPTVALVWQFLIFAFIAVFIAVCWWLYLKRRPQKITGPVLNRRGTQYIGRIFTLDVPVVNGVGSIHVDDTRWRIHCSDLPKGARVRVTDADGVILLAEPVLTEL